MKTSPVRLFAGFSRVVAAVLIILAGWFSAPLRAQSPAPAETPERVLLGPQELEDLLAPVALYPDALIALILPATTVPSDVVLGARFLRAEGDGSLVDSQPWDDSVKSLTRYPDVLLWLDENLEWTAAVGEAFVEQPADVMNAVQALREKARAAGHLVDTPEQKVVVEEEVIRIIPADPEIIYVPQYDPTIIYVQSYTPVYTPILTFGIGFAVGSWLNYDFDWRRRCVYRGNWRGWNHWNDRRGWNTGGNWVGGRNTNVINTNVNVVNIDTTNLTQWQPSAAGRRQVTQRQRNNTGNARFVRSEARRTVARGERAGEVGLPRSVETGRSRLPQPTRLAVSETQSRLNRGDGERTRPATAPSPDGSTRRIPRVGAERTPQQQGTPSAVETPSGLAGTEDAIRNDRRRQKPGSTPGSAQGNRTPFRGREGDEPVRVERRPVPTTQAPRVPDPVLRPTESRPGRPNPSPSEANRERMNRTPNVRPAVPSQTPSRGNPQRIPMAPTPRTERSQERIRPSQAPQLAPPQRRETPAPRSVNPPSRIDRPQAPAVPQATRRQIQPRQAPPSLSPTQPQRVERRSRDEQPRPQIQQPRTQEQRTQRREQVPQFQRPIVREQPTQVQQPRPQMQDQRPQRRELAPPPFRPVMPETRRQQVPQVSPQTAPVQTEGRSRGGGRQRD